MTVRSTPPRLLSRRKKVAFALLTLLAVLTLYELSARLLFFVKEGLNPYYLSYGFAPDVEWNANEQNGYSKFFPNTTRHQTVRGQIANIRINSDGFRSRFDFAKPKPAGTIRIAALGGSSTFGYEDLDDETYPAYLQQMLRERIPGRTIEVLNLGIPQIRMDNIVALARSELPALQPDLMTFYEGYNNAMMPKARHEAGLPYRIKDWFYFHSVGYRTLHAGLRSAYHNSARLLNRDLAGTHGLDLPITLRREQVEHFRRVVTEEFTRDLTALADFAAQQRIPLIVVTQPMTLQQPHQPRWPTYDQEVANLRRELELSGRLTARETVLLTHADLQQSVRVLAGERRLLMVEGIGLLDEGRRENMASIVHLTPQGNRRLTRGLVEAVLRSGVLDDSNVAGHSDRKRSP